MATAYFMELVTRMTDAEEDQQHMKMHIYSDPTIPDRTSYLLGDASTSPIPGLVEAGQALARLGAEVIAIPCVTAHCFYGELSRKIPVPIVHAAEETARYLMRENISKVGILATDGTLASRLFQEAFARYNIQFVLPSPRHQADIMELIYSQVKAGKPVEISKLLFAIAQLRYDGAEAILLGCTELSLLNGRYPLGSGILDVLEVLARQSVLSCGYPLRPEYQDLISKGDA